MDKVIEPFICIDTGIRYDIGDFYPSQDPERLRILRENGFLNNVTREDSLEELLKPLGGGYYDLPNGDRIRGKKNALEKLNKLSKPPPNE